MMRWVNCEIITINRRDIMLIGNWFHKSFCSDLGSKSIKCSFVPENLSVQLDRLRQIEDNWKLQECSFLPWLCWPFKLLQVNICILGLYIKNITTILHIYPIFSPWRRTSCLPFMERQGLEMQAWRAMWLQNGGWNYNSGKMPWVYTRHD